MMVLADIGKPPAAVKGSLRVRSSFPYMNVRKTAKVTSKGQITLPLAIRKQLGVEAGDTVVFELTGDGIRVQREREPAVFEPWIGRFRSGHGKTAAEIDRYIKAGRGHRDE